MILIVVYFSIIVLRIHSFILKNFVGCALYEFKQICGIYLKFYMKSLDFEGTKGE